MDNKDIFFQKQSNYCLFWIILITILIILFLVGFFYEYTPYYVTTGIYDKEDGYVTLLLENNKLFYVKSSKISVDKEIIDNNDIVVGEYIVAENKVYNEIFILNKNIDKSIINITFELPKTTILKKIWKGMIEWI